MNSLFSDSLQGAPKGVDRIVCSRICSRETIAMDCISTCSAAAAVVPQILLWHIIKHAMHVLCIGILNQHSAVLDITSLSI